ncbi:MULTISPECIES: hypothetical protein [unclassified Streptomyces]|uniref:hypothetical protein n=1 Tax=unclassified Streptomyces TaxID=2593676 RepID=UPI0035DC44AF
MSRILGRLAASLAAVLLLVGLAAPAAVASAPAAAPAAPAVDWWGIGQCATWLLPNVPSGPTGAIECAKAAVKGGKVIGETNKKVISAASQKVKDSVLGDAAASWAEFVGEFMRIGFGWWLATDSVQVKDSGVLNNTKDPSKSMSLHALMAGIGAGIATLLVIFQGIKMIIQRKGAPLGHIVQGLMMNLLVSAAGVAIIDSLLIASDQLTKAILYVGFGGDNVPDRMAAMLLPAIVNPVGLLVVAFVVFIVSGTQLVMLFLRQAAIPIQALLLPIAGAGQLGGDGARQWLPRLFTAVMVIIVYKPVAALIISVGFIEMANGSGVIDFIRGVVTLALSVLALKSLMALFAPLGLSMGNAVSAGGGLGGALSIAGSAMGSQMGSAGGSGGSGSTSAAQHAAAMERSGPATQNGRPAEGSTAINQASNVPTQGGSAATANAAATGTGQATSAGSTLAKGAAGPVAIAVVAAEAAKTAKNSAGGAMGGQG